MFYKFYQCKIITGSSGNPYFQFISPHEEYEIRGAVLLVEAGSEIGIFKNQEEDIEENIRKFLEKAAQIKSTAVEAKRVAASCIYM